MGWTIQCDAGLSKQWALLVPKLWGMFYANLRQPGWYKLGVKRQFSLLARTVEPVALRALSAWGPTPHYVDSLNRLQRKMVATLLRLWKYPGEEWRHFRLVPLGVVLKTMASGGHASGCSVACDGTSICNATTKSS